MVLRKSSRVTKPTESPYCTVDFGRIPIDTNTLAGQWMTFSHMANHYRKLLNVKPRVDSGLPSASTPALGGSYGNLRATTKLSKMIQSSNHGKKKKSTNTTSIYNHHHHEGSSVYSSHPDNLNICSSSPRKTSKDVYDNHKHQLTIKSPIKNGRSSRKTAVPPQYPEYQVVFGPSSIQSSSDGFLSDETESSISNENSKPPSDVQTPIGVTEKIRRFLNHIHQLDLTASQTAKKKRPKTGVAKSVPIAQTQSDRPLTASTKDRRPSRHSKCFLPYEPESPKTPRRQQCASASVPLIAGGVRIPKSPKRDQHLIRFDHRDKPLKQSRTSSVAELNAMIPEKDTNAGIGKRHKSRKRAESIGSIGTICGSDELTAEDYPEIKDIYSNGDGIDDQLLDRIIREAQSGRNVKKKQSRTHLEDEIDRHRHQVRLCPSSTSLTKSISMASLLPSSNEGGNADGNKIILSKSARNHHRHKDKPSSSTSVVPNNNKDSSRDSAYGFSSGESRITTRESTPEKKCSSHGHHSSHGRSSHRSHVDFSEQPCKDTIKSTASSDVDKRSKSRSRGSGRMKAASTQDLRRRDSNESYINFLNDVTQDIVRKGIYTNKGLKTLIKSHVEHNRDLDKEKLANMVERLRMDLGIPKDDSLDKIEFGYGSVSADSKSAFFYTPSTAPRVKDSTESIILAAQSGTQLPEETLLSSCPEVESSPSSKTIIPAAVLPQVVEAAAQIASTSTTTTGFSSGGPNTGSYRSSTRVTEDGSGGGDFASESRHFDEDDDEGNVDDELSLSETEVSQYLKVAGLDEGTMQSVMGILKS